VPFGCSRLFGREQPDDVIPAQPVMALVVQEPSRRAAAGFHALKEKEQEPGAAREQSHDTDKDADEYQRSLKS
jgi:hypothetical protein